MAELLLCDNKLCVLSIHDVGALSHNIYRALVALVKHT